LFIYDNLIIKVSFFFIWGVIIFVFFLKLLVAPKRNIFIKNNLLIVFSLLIPPFRIYTIMNVISRKNKNSKSYTHDPLRKRNNKKE
jgi:hypothetical protein